MHPILASGRRLLVYLLLSIPFAALLAYGLAAATAHMSLGQAAAVAAPSTFVFAFVCLSPYYVCRAQSLELSNAWRLVLTFAAAAATAGGLLAGTVRLGAILFEFPIPPVSLLFGWGVVLYLLSVGLHYAALARESSRAAERRAAEARTLAREAELHALRIQLNPHFLFNSLNSISALATIDGSRAREMCLRLAEFLRSSLGLGSRESIPLSEELALARRYLEVEQVRFGERLKVQAEIEPSCENCGVPGLLLQPLVENAVKHGIAQLVQGGAIRLAAERRGSDVAITLENAFDPESPARRGTGLGLAHVRRRLQVRYGEAATMDARPVGEIYRVVLRLPCESPIASNSRA